ncbi:MAG: phasin family protein [Gammaproteobacteria bacterium]
MQKDYSEQWSEICGAYSKPLSELNELNTKMLSELYEKGNACIKNITNAKRPEEFVSSQLKFAMDSSACTVEYFQDLLALLKNSSTDMTKSYGNYANDAIKNSTNAFTGKHKATTEK